MLYFKKCWIFTCLILFQLAHAQNKGIQFETDKSFQEILNQAAKENKFIFIDCYTTWCGPCKFMDKEIFVQDTVGTFYNSHFINTRYQMDTTKMDALEIKNRYSDVNYIKQYYKIKAYPTYLFISPNGELVHRELGSCDAFTFIQRGINSLSPETQYYTQLKNYYAGKRDTVFLKKLTLLSLQAFEDSVTRLVTKSYLNSIGPKLTSDNYKFINEVTNDVSDTGFILMLNNTKDFETAIGAKRFHDHLISIITFGENKTNNYFTGWDEQKWKIYSKDISEKYPTMAGEILFNIKSGLLEMNENWKDLIQLIDTYKSKNSISNQILNSFAWSIFKKVNDPIYLKKALEWSMSTFSNQPSIEPGYIDTYANLLYKLGRKKEALKWEKKAQQIAISQGADKNWGQDVIDKINKGEKTWN